MTTATKSKTSGKKPYTKKPATSGEQQPTRKEQMAKTVETGFADLLAQIQQGKSEHMKNFLLTMAKFWEYSPSNQALIEFQSMMMGFEPSHVAGFNQWKERFGRQVKKGAHAIWIWAPTFSNVDDPDHPGDKVRIRTGFIPVYVFDKAQLEPDAEKDAQLDFFFNLPGSYDEQYARAVAACEADGFKVEEMESLGKAGAQGYNLGKLIALKAGLPSHNKILTLFHEWTHAYLKHATFEGQKISKQVKECQAEATAFVVAAVLGIENPFSSDYLQNWGNDVKTLQAEMEEVSRAAKHILNQLQTWQSKVGAAILNIMSQQESK